ncbi:MAG TPA: FAD-dependent oxidoreductase, partial [Ktedonobacterales bacterium]|jgi:sarcosine oxidase subunit beta
VIGAGLTGLWLAWHLRRLGVERVVVLERDYAGCELYGRFSAGVRLQFSTRIEIELTQASLPFFDLALQEPRLRAEYEPVGYAFLASERQATGLRDAWSLQRSLGVRTAWLEGAELSARFPYCDLEGVVAATFCADEFWLNPWELHQWLLQSCRAAGVSVYEYTPVTGIAVSAGRIRAALCQRLAVETDTLVNAAGARAREVCQLAGSDVPISAEPRVKYLVPAPAALPRTMPLVTDLRGGVYVRNERGEAIIGVKPPRADDSDAPGNEDALLAWMRRQAARSFPALATDEGAVTPSRIIHGQYDVAPDGLPVVGPDPRVGGLYIAAGFNGHGVMHSPSVARAVAEQIALGASQGVDVGPLSSVRFAAGAAATPPAFHLL